MQAEGWKAEWSIAMQENERLRMALFDAQAPLTLTLTLAPTPTLTLMALFDAQAALEALPPSETAEEKQLPKPAVADEGELQWRELCTSIARGADEEKAILYVSITLTLTVTLALTRRRPFYMSP